MPAYGGPFWSKYDYYFYLSLLLFLSIYICNKSLLKYFYVFHEWKKWLLVSGPIHYVAVNSLEFTSVEEEDVDKFLSAIS